MNLRQIANRMTRAINPNLSAEIYRSAGEVTAEDGSVTPSYDDMIIMQVQKQAVNQDDLKHIENQNIQGMLVSIYTNGNWCGMNRKKDQGGDLFVIGNDTWLVLAVPEIWPDWTHAICVLQLDNK